MQIKIDRLRLQNFKGICELTLDLNGADAAVTGDNGTGKTTIYDSFLWCLFDKDSAGRSSFDIKPLDEDGQPIHLLESGVELDLDIDGEKLQLKKIYREKWVKKRGDSESSFSGHETLYWVNEVPVKAGEYKAKIAERIDEATFRRITGPEYFMSLNTRDMRSVLIDMVGALPLEQIAGDDPQLQTLIGIMKEKRYTPEDLAKVVRQRITEANAEIRNIPARIDEVRRGIPEAEIWPKLEKERETLRQELKDIETALLDARQAASMARERQNRVNTLYSDLSAKKRQLAEAANAEAYKHKAEVEKLRLEISRGEDEIKNLEDIIEDREHNIKVWEEQISSKRKEYLEHQEQMATIKAEEFPGLEEGETVCSACGQELPGDRIDELKSKASSAFDARKERRITEVVKLANQAALAGKRLKEQIEQHKDAIAVNRRDLETAKSTLESNETKLEVLAAQTFEEKTPEDFKDADEVKAIQSQIDELEKTLDSEDGNSSWLLERKTELADDLGNLDRRLAKKDQIEAAQKRIAELEKRNRELADMVTEQEGIKYAIELFIRTKAEMLETKINGLFSYIQFRLFKQNINGGIEDDCEPLIKGVPYSTGGSYSERVRAGLDIVRTMQRHADIFAPVFVDNAESLTWLLTMDCQTIVLIVKEECKQLEIKIKAA
jgi:DNA repair exonuclease SbcCD ATPase subunit